MADKKNGKVLEEQKALSEPAPAQHFSGWLIDNSLEFTAAEKLFLASIEPGITPGNKKLFVAARNMIEKGYHIEVMPILHNNTFSYSLATFASEIRFILGKEDYSNDACLIDSLDAVEPAPVGKNGDYKLHVLLTRVKASDKFPGRVIAVLPGSHKSILPVEKQKVEKLTLSHLAVVFLHPKLLAMEVSEVKPVVVEFQEP